MLRKPLHRLTLLSAALGVATGLAVGTSWGASGVREGLRAVEELAPELPMDPLRGITRAEALARAEQARDHLEEGRPWAAWNTLEPFVREPSEADRPVVLLAARAATAWTGWREVRTLLRDQPWLAREAEGEGLYLLGRGEEGGEEWSRAASAYQRYLTIPGAPRRQEAFARLGSVLTRAGDPRAAALAYQRAAEIGGPAADWFAALAVEAGAPAASFPGEASAASRVRLALAVAGRGGGSAHLAREAEALAGSDPDAAAELRLALGRQLLSSDPSAARAALLAAMSPDVAPAMRGRAAALLGELPDQSAADELARAAAYEAARKPGPAARSLRAALRLGAPDTPEERLRLGRLLWEAVDLQPARAALLDAAERLSDPGARAEAELLAARALVRMGKRDEGIAALKRVARAYPDTRAAGDAWFHLGDLSTTLELGIANYRRAAVEERSANAPEALWRLGDRLRRSGDAVGAATAWGRLATRFPGAPQAPRAGYQAGRLHEAAGRADAGAAAYRAAIAADPTSYYAVRAADRLGADPLAAPLAAPIDWSGGDDAAVQRALARLDVLEQAGLTGHWKQELEAQRRALRGRPAALLSLAEGVRDRGHTVEGIRIGRALLEETGGRWDERLLRLVFPLPLPELLRREADRSDVDPYLLAGLVRQESSWNPLARSHVGATGLAQVMPSTGAWLARSAGVRDFRTHLLTVPEVGLRMGARYLRDQMKRYRGRRDLALAAYNAGPGRADRWRREIAAGRDVDAFREAIPFDETREYVKLVIRNAEVYRRLYGGPGGAGLVHDG